MLEFINEIKTKVNELFAYEAIPPMKVTMMDRLLIAGESYYPFWVSIFSFIFIIILGPIVAIFNGLFVALKTMMDAETWGR